MSVVSHVVDRQYISMRMFCTVPGAINPACPSRVGQSFTSLILTNKRVTNYALPNTRAMKVIADLGGTFPKLIFDSSLKRTVFQSSSVRSDVACS